MFGWYSPNIESFQTLLIAFYWKLTAYAQKDKRMSLEMENVLHMENKNEQTYALYLMSKCVYAYIKFKCTRTMKAWLPC